MMQFPRIKVIVVDDQALIRDGIRLQLDKAPVVEIVGEGSAGEHLMPLIEQHNPDVVLLDLEMPQKEGESLHNGALPFHALSAVRSIKKRHPDTRILVVSQHLNRGIINAIMKSGANGYLLKDDAMSKQLVIAIRTVWNGGVCVSPDVRHVMMTGAQDEYTADVLTERQQDILRQMILYPEIKIADKAKNLSITESTFRNHLGDIRDRLGVSSTTAAMLMGIRMGIAQLSAISFENGAEDLQAKIPRKKQHL